MSQCHNLKKVQNSKRKNITIKIQNCKTNGQKLFKTVQNGPKLSKWSNMVLFCPKQFKVVQKSLKWCKRVQKV